ncbi:leucine-rich repeat protein [Treponema sp. R80B11-R83G3]
MKKGNSVAVVRLSALCLAALAVFCLLCTCAPPTEGGEGDASVTITIGSGNRAALTLGEQTIDTAQLDHTITMTNGSGANVEKTGVRVGQSVQFTVTPGHWNITVLAYFDGTLVAKGSESVDLKPGRNGSVPIKMTQVGVTPAIETYEIIMLTNNDDYGTATAEPNPAPEGETVYIHANSYDGYRFDTWEVISGDVTLSEPQKSHTEFTMPSNSVTIMANFKEVPPDTPNLEIQDDAIFEDVTYGYLQPDAMTVSIHNSGTYTAIVSSIELSGTNAALFTLVKSLPLTIEAGASSDFSVQPQRGLSEGTYTAKITATYSGGVVNSDKAEAEVSFKVHPAPISFYEITLTIPVEDKTPAKAITATDQYSGSVTWNIEDTTFKGGTEYTATIQLNINANYTLTGVGTNSFKVTGATSTTYTAGSDIVTAVFPKAAFSSIASLSTWLDGQGTNEPITAYNIKLNVDSFGGNASISGSLGYVLIRNNTKYVNLDLSSSTMTEIPELAFFDDVDYEGCNTLVGITIPNSVTSIGEAAFANCIRLTNVTFTPTGRVTSIGNEAFAECISLASITIPASVESIGDMAFYGCTKLADITFTPTSKVTSIGAWGFYGCTSLTGITIPTSVNSIGNDAFTDCSSLAAITVDTGNTAYSSQGGILYNNDKTAIVLVPIKITGAITIPNSVESIEFGAFSSRAGLTSVTIGNGVDNIGNGAFSYCTSLADITFTPTSKVTSIGDSAFANCTNLDSITIPNSVTRVRTPLLPIALILYQIRNYVNTYYSLLLPITPCYY